MAGAYPGFSSMKLLRLLLLLPGRDASPSQGSPQEYIAITRLYLGQLYKPRVILISDEPIDLWTPFPPPPPPSHWRGKSSGIRLSKIYYVSLS